MTIPCRFMTVGEFIEYLKHYPDEMPIVIRQGIGWSGMANYTPELGEATILATGSDDYDKCREEMEEGKHETIEVVTIGREGYN